MIYTFPPWNIHSSLHFKPVLRGNLRQVNSKSQSLVKASCSPWTVPSFVFINLFNLDSVLAELPRWLSGWRIYLQFRRHRRLRFNPWVRKIPWRRKWQHTPIHLPGKSQGQWILTGYSPWRSQRVRQDLATKQQQEPIESTWLHILKVNT